MSTADTKTFWNGQGVTLTSCYYTTTVGDTQGTQCYKVTLAASPADGGMVDGGTPTTSNNFLKVYNNGIICNGIYYTTGNVSLTATANEDYVFTGWSDNNTDNPRTVSVSSNTSYTANFYVPSYITTIASKADWDAFCAAVNAGHDYSGETVTMTDNVNTAVTTMAGVSSNTPFRGTFDGQGHTLNVNISSAYQGAAPFMYLDGATIQNLNVTGSVRSSNHHAGGLVGFTYNGSATYSNSPVTGHDVTIQNCHVSVNVTAPSTSNNYCGGIVGHAKTNHTTIIGCVYDGTISSSGYKGGIIGWSERSQVTITDTYFNGTNSGTGSFNPVGCKTQTQNDNNVTVALTLNNFYHNYSGTILNTNYAITYNTTYADAMGNMLAHSITGDTNVTVAYAGTATNYNCSGITSYGTGIKYNDVLYAGNGDQVSLTLGCTLPSGQELIGYTASNGGSLSGSANPFTLTMPNDNTVISGDFIALKLHIANTTSLTLMTWDEFAAKVNDGIDYSGYTVLLDEDITVSTMAGISESHPFKGTFDGQGYTMTLDLTATEAICAPFRYINDATIQNLKVAGTLTGGNNKQLGGLVGVAYGTSSIVNCIVSATILSSYSGDSSHSGFVMRVYNSNTSNLSFTGCAFTGTFDCPSSDRIAGFVGWRETNNYTIPVTLTNCLFMPANIDCSATTLNSNFVRSRNGDNGVTLTNTYYTEGIPASSTTTSTQGKKAYTITGDTDITVQNVGTATNYSVSGITSYGTGIKFNDVLYAGEGDNVVLALSGAPDYEADHGTLVDNGDTFTLTMEAADTQISYIYCSVPYNVVVNNVNFQSAQISWSGNSDSYTLQYREVITPPTYGTYSYNFDNGTLQGWTSYDEDGDGDAWSNTDTEHHGGSHCLYSIFNIYNVTNDWLISPEIPLGGTISFYAKKFSSGDKEQFQVYVSTTGTDISNFTPITDVMNVTTDWRLYEYSLSNYSGNGYVAIKHTAPAHQYCLYVDDITITYPIAGVYGAWQTVNPAVSPQPIDDLTLLTTYQVRVRGNCTGGATTDYSDVVEFTTPVVCPAPTELAVTDGSLTTHEATITWTENGEATEWQICLNGDETNLITADSNPFTLDNLTPATIYTVKVRAYCSDDDQSYWSNRVSFTTECEDITLPYTYGFEQTGELGCWTMTNCIEGTGISQYANHEGEYGFQFHWVNQSEQYLISPEFESTAQLAVSFYYKNYDERWEETFCVGYSTTTNDVAAFTWVVQITTYSENTWKFYSNVFPAGTKYVAIKHISDDAYYLYVDDFSFQPVFTKTIVGVGEENWDGGKSGYYLVASPVTEEITPAATNGFIPETAANYDLYSFNQVGDEEGNEWINFKDTNDGGYNLTNGKGYLYASKNGTTLTFSGTPYSGNGQVNLVYDSNAAEFAGWNLVGNPFAQDAYADRDYYAMQNGSELIPTGSATIIGAMDGIFVTAADADDASMTFSTESQGAKSASLTMNVTKAASAHRQAQGSSTLVDRAIVRFGEGGTLPKFQLRESSTKVYIPQDGKDYAIVNVASMGEMPVNFKAENNGIYTLSFTAEEVSFSYLHLIDNMTGIETDLLANPSYSFEAKTTDYESRFKLVFATKDGPSTGSGTFAFYSNGSFIINNEGEATLQVIDVNGRILKSESINGCTNINVNAAQGIYMLRLVNGDNVKVQKVVVR